jgi:monovalent cation:proton antiporter-2 (CPA2) family protein
MGPRLRGDDGRQDALEGGSRRAFMADNHSLLIDVIIFLAAGVIAVPLFTRLGLGSVLGYLAAGAAIGPWGLALIDTVEQVLHFAELGVVLLLFVIGLELNPARLWQMRLQVFGLGALQILLSALILGGVAYYAGWTPLAAAVIGFGLALSSTAFVLQILGERGDLYSGYGRTSFAILLMQDLAVVPLLATVPLLAGVGGEQEFSWGPVLRAIAVVGGVILAGHFLIRPAFALISKARANEVLTAAALLLVLGAAWLLDQVGMSMGLGAFLVGMLMAETEYRHQLEADIEPFRGLLLGLFFIAVGMSVDFGVLRQQGWAVLGLALGMMAIKALVLLLLARVFGSDWRRAGQVALVMPQGGEFAFVLFGLAAVSGVFDTATANLLIVVVTLSMVLTPFLVKLQDPLLRRLGPAVAIPDEQIPDTGNPVLIAGFGRVGQIVGKVLATQGINYTAVDPNPEQIQVADQHGYKIYYGDATRADLLHAAGADKAKLIVVAIDDPAIADRAVQTIKHHFPHLKILARARNRQHALRLVDVRADYVIRETFESSLKLGETALQMLGVDAVHTHEAVDEFREEDLSHLDVAIEPLMRRPPVERLKDEPPV